MQEEKTRKDINLEKLNDAKCTVLSAHLSQSAMAE